MNSQQQSLVFWSFWFTYGLTSGLVAAIVGQPLWLWACVQVFGLAMAIGYTQMAMRYFERRRIIIDADVLLAAARRQYNV